MGAQVLMTELLAVQVVLVVEADQPKDNPTAVLVVLVRRGKAKMVDHLLVVVLVPIRVPVVAVAREP